MDRDGTTDLDWLEASGDIEELNAYIGVVLASLPDADTRIHSEGREIQSLLLRISLWLAGKADISGTAGLAEDCLRLREILRFSAAEMGGELSQAGRSPMPDGHLSASMALMARSICERARRRLNTILDEPPEVTNSHILRSILDFLEHLSAYLVLLSNKCNKIASDRGLLH